MAENREQRPDRSAKGVIAEKHVPVNADENTAVPPAGAWNETSAD
jgi:hypothetical protein